MESAYTEIKERGPTRSQKSWRVYTEDSVYTNERESKAKSKTTRRRRGGRRKIRSFLLLRAPNKVRATWSFSIPLTFSAARIFSAIANNRTLFSTRSIRSHHALSIETRFDVFCLGNPQKDGSFSELRRLAPGFLQEEEFVLQMGISPQFQLEKLENWGSKSSNCFR